MGLATIKYKQTEVGSIPIDWSLKTFKEIFKVNQGLQIAIDQRQKHPSLKSKKYITIQYLNDGKSVEYINDYSESVCCERKDILMTRTGNTGMVITNVEGVFHNNFFKINFDRNKLDKDFIVFFLNQPSTQRRIMDKAGTSTIPDLNHNDFYSLSIPLPPTINEQKAIARVLTDTDALIQALEKKIAKKKLIKKGMMQKLLTPKEDWEVKTLGDFLDYEQPTNYVVESTEYNDNYDIPVLTAGKSFILGYTNEKDGIFENYPVIIFDDFTTATKFVDFPFKVKSSALKILKPKNKDVILGFIFEIMQQINFPLGDHKRHWIGEFQPLEIMVPKSKNEQIYIAQILADMGQEIAQLEEKLSKYQLAKQGMMQQLLSGKTRLL